MPTPYLSLDTRRKTRRGYPVKLYIYHEGRDYGPMSLKWYMEEKDWQDIDNPPRRTDNTASRIEAAKKNSARKTKILDRAEKAIGSLDYFSWPAFKATYKNPAGNKSTLRHWYAFHESQAETVGTREWYQGSWKKVVAFADENIPVEAITPDWLRRFDTYMESDGLSPTSRSIYIRALKSVINTATAQGHYRHLNPFGKGFFRMPKTEPNKRALTEEQLNRILSYDTSRAGPSYRFALDVFTFSYLCFGANPADIFRLKETDIQDGKITFTRIKTDGRSNRSTPITVEIREAHQKIIDTWRPFSKEPYLFPVYSPEMTEEEEYNAKKNKINSINKRLKKIAKWAGVDVPISMQYARHTWATLAREKGIEKWVISILMGHSSPEVTENYFGRVDSDRLKEAQDRTMPGHGS